MELRQLRYFVEVCRTRSFMSAAENCLVSPQGVSNSIRRLEAELQSTLFIRSRSGLSLTKHAKFLLPLAEKIMDNIDICDNFFSSGKSLNQRLEFTLARGAFDAFAKAPVQEFKETYPHVFLDIRYESDVGAETSVLCNEAELALCSGPVNTELLDAIYICSSRFAAFVRVNHPLAEHDAIAAGAIHLLTQAPRPTAGTAESSKAGSCRQGTR